MKMRGSVLLALCLGLSISSGLFSQEKTLDLPRDLYISQRHSCWCFAACTEITVRYYLKYPYGKAQQCNIVGTIANKADSCCPDPNPTLPLYYEWISPCNITVYSQTEIQCIGWDLVGDSNSVQAYLAKIGINSTGYDHGQSYDKEIIINAINNNRPFIIVRIRNNNPSGNPDFHCLFGFGYRELGNDIVITYWDPDLYDGKIKSDSLSILYPELVGILVMNDPPQFEIAFTSDGNGTISGTNPQKVSSGNSCQPVTAIPNSGYVFSHWEETTNNYTWPCESDKINPTLIVENATWHYNFKAVFVEPGDITFTSPVANETWQYSSVHSINWNCNSYCSARGNIYLVTPDNQWVASIWNNIDLSVGAFTWIVGDYVGYSSILPVDGQYRIRIGPANGDEITWGVSEVFSLTGTPPAVITVTSPNGGELWDVGTVHNITWTSSGIVPRVTIEYSTDNGLTYKFIPNASGIDNTKSFAWTVPNDPSTQCLVRIVSTHDTSVFDASNGVFTITGMPPASLTVISPNGGESWEAGTTHNITWTNTGTVSRITIEYSTDNGATYKPIPNAAGIDNYNSFQWTVPNDPSTQCRVKVTSTLAPSTFDISNAAFTIRSVPPPPSLVVTSPTAADWVESNSRVPWTIRWTYSPSLQGKLVHVYLLNEAQQTLYAIAYNVLINNQSLGWWVAQNLKDGWYYIKIITTDGQASALSERFFIHFRFNVTYPGPGDWVQSDSGTVIRWEYASSLVGKTVTFTIVYDNGAPGPVVGRNVPVTAGSYGYWMPALDPGWYSIECMINDGKNPAYSEKFHIYH